MPHSLPLPERFWAGETLSEGKKQSKKKKLSKLSICAVDAKYKTVTYNTSHVTVFHNIGKRKHFPSSRTYYYVC